MKYKNNSNTHYNLYLNVKRLCKKNPKHRTDIKIFT